MSRVLGSSLVQRWGSASAIALDSFLEYSQNIILSATKIHIFTSTNFQISSSDKLFLMKFTNLNPPCQKNITERKCVGWRTGTRTSARGCSAQDVCTFLLCCHPGLPQNSWDHTQTSPSNIHETHKEIPF